MSILDADRRAFFPITCRLTWKGRTLRRVRCAPTTAAEQAQPLAIDERPSVRGAVPGHRLVARAAAARLTAPNTATPAATHGSRAGAQTLTVAPIESTVVSRLRGAAASSLSEQEREPTMGDVNGDGRPDFTVGDPLLDPAVALSGPTGWHTVPLRIDGDEEPMAVPDLTGDGIDDFAAPFGDRVIGGSRTWSTTLPRAINLTSRRVLTPGDFALAPTDTNPLGSGPLVGLPDTTGDGRPELGIGSISGAGLAIFASEAVPLGRTSRLPVFQAGAIADDIAKVSEMEHDQSVDGDSASERIDAVLPVRGGALLGRTDLTIAKRVARTTIALAPVSPAPPWPVTSSAPFTVAGIASIADYDASSGETLITSSYESCNVQTYHCIVRVRRVNAFGQITATVSVRAAAGELEASFVTDGPDADALAEVLIHDGESSNLGVEAMSGRPGLDGTVALWSSTLPTASLFALPVLSTRTAPLVVYGPLLRWTALDGRRFHAGYVQAGAGKKRTQTLTLLGALR